MLLQITLQLFLTEREVYYTDVFQPFEGGISRQNLFDSYGGNFEGQKKKGYMKNVGKFLLFNIVQYISIFDVEIIKYFFLKIINRLQTTRVKQNK